MGKGDSDMEGWEGLGVRGQGLGVWGNVNEIEKLTIGLISQEFNFQVIDSINKLEIRFVSQTFDL